MDKTTSLILLAFPLGVLITPTAVCIYQAVRGDKDAAQAAVISAIGLLLVGAVFVLVATGAR